MQRITMIEWQMHDSRSPTYMYDKGECRAWDGDEWSIYIYITAGVGVCPSRVHIGMCGCDCGNGWGVYV